MANRSKKTIRILALSSFLNDLGSDIIYPIWPLFVTTVLRANMTALGFLDGLGEALVSLSQAASGYISDRIKKRKIFIWAGYLFGSCARLGYSLSRTWLHLIPFRMLDRTGKIRSAPRDALIADISPPEERGRNFGFLRTMDNLGAVFGILLCIALFPLLGYRLLFALAAFPSLLSFGLILFFISEPRTRMQRASRGIRLKDVGKNFRLYLLLSSIFSLGNFSYSFFLIYAREFGFKTGFIPLLYLLFTAMASLSSLPFGRLSDKIGRKMVLFLSFFLWISVCSVLLLSQKLPLVLLVFVLYGAHKGALEPVQKTYVCELAPGEFRASCLGAFQMIVGLCALPASFVAGLLWEKAGIFIPLYFSLCLTIISATILTFIKSDDNKPLP